MLKVCAVFGLAKKLHLKKNDEILFINGYPAVDELDYLYATSNDSFSLTVKRKDNTFDLNVEKEAEDDFGLVFEKQEEIRTCHNHCIFCFVDQMPKGLRSSLYVKDDDYTMSFACGNFVTLTNLTDEDLDRIIRLRLSPLYVSVHTMNPELRCQLLRNRYAGKIVSQMERLAKAGLTIHTQAVVVPYQNDGAELARTARELFAYYPNVKDLAVVPTGLTKFREGLTEILDVDGAYSEQFLDLVDSLNQEFGVNFILPADEYFIKSNRPFKSSEFYGEFEQIENGIGMTTKFTTEFYNAVTDGSLSKVKHTLVVSGVSAAKINQSLCECAMSHVKNLQASVLAVPNTFFGETVTCTGLLTGVDILAALQKQEGTYDEVILPGNTMREFEDVFLCGMTLEELKKQLHFQNIRINRQGGEGFFEILSTVK